MRTARSIDRISLVSAMHTPLPRMPPCHACPPPHLPAMHAPCHACPPPPTMHTPPPPCMPLAMHAPLPCAPPCLHTPLCHACPPSATHVPPLVDSTHTCKAHNHSQTLFAGGNKNAAVTATRCQYPGLGRPPCEQADASENMYLPLWSVITKQYHWYLSIL